MDLYGSGVSLHGKPEHARGQNAYLMTVMKCVQIDCIGLGKTEGGALSGIEADAIKL